MDGRLAKVGAPGLLNMTARRALNLAYATAVEWMDKDERDTFEQEISMTALQLQIRETVKEYEVVNRRLQLAKDFGEVG